LETAKGAAFGSINNKLNNAYYLDHYFKMAHELNRSYPLNYHSFRNGFYSWEHIQNKEKDYRQFREIANVLLKGIKDSISLIQDNHVATTNYLIQNMNTVNYSTLKDSLTKLPPDYKSKSWYYGTVINEVAKQQPAYFFKLAEDFPRIAA
jgi:ATP-dependent RNA circularization protein (DNA/RNA ligase family)